MRVEPEQNASVSNRKADDAPTNRGRWSNYVHGIASFKGRARAVKTTFCGIPAGWLFM